MVALPSRDLPLLANLLYALREQGYDPGDPPFVFLLIQHLLSDAPSLIRHLLPLGCSKEDMHIMGIWYSTKPEVVDELQRDGFDVRSPADDEEAHVTVRELVTLALDKCQQQNKRLIIIEDGGYAVPLIHQEFADRAHLIVGAVEQTTRGITNDERVAWGDGDLHFPVISIPKCSLKREFEPPFIAEAAVARLNSLLLNHFDDSIRDKDVTLLGYGSVGSAIAGELERIGARVTIWDQRAIRRAAAAAAGIQVTETVEQAVARAHIVVGATGAADGPSVTRELLQSHVRDRAYLVSVSSRQEEIDLRYLRSECANPEPITDAGTRYIIRSGKEFVVLADGTPLNFFRAQSAGKKAMQLILALLWEGARVLITRSDLPRRILPGSEYIDEERLAEQWLPVKDLPLYDPRFTDE